MAGLRAVGIATGAALALAACGGGGGGAAGGGGGGGGGGPTAAASGHVTFDRGTLGTLSEAEPNDSVSQVHGIGLIRPGQTISVAGTLGTGGDVFDGFQVRALQRAKITAVLTLSDPSTADFDLALYDPVSLQFLEDFAGSGPPETGVFHAKGPFDLVVRRTSGQGSYTLRITAEAASPTILEREPNGTPVQAQPIGEVVTADFVAVTGTASAASDPDESVVLACPAAVRLHVELSSPAFTNYDVVVLDATAGLAAPAYLAAFSSPTNTEAGDVNVPAGTLVVVRVHAVTGAGLWTLTLRGDPPVSGLSMVHAAGARLVPLALEGGALRRAAPPDAAFGRPAGGFRRGQVLVSFEPGAETQVEADIAARGGRVVEKMPGDYYLVTLPGVDGLAEEDARRVTVARAGGLLSAAVKSAGLNRLHKALSTTPNDPRYNQQWGYPRIRCPEAWDLTTGDPSVVVAVVDTGKTDHPDLSGKWTAGYDFVSDLDNSVDGDGRDSDPTDPGDDDASFHGTHVAGTIGAASNNGVGVAGVAWGCKVMPVRVLGWFGGFTNDIVQGIRFAAGLSNASGTLPAKRADVINMSFGLDVFDSAEGDACWAAHQAGVVLVAAAGNDNSQATFYPAAFPGVISVMAVGYDLTRAPYSNYGSWVDIAAPGGNSEVDKNGDGHTDGILSTIYIPGTGFTYAWHDGTSMASPHVAGVAALVLSVHPTLTPDEVETILESTALDLGAAGKDSTFGWGLVDAYLAVKAALPHVPVPPALSVAPLSLNFGVLDTGQDVSVSNLGDGLVTVTSITPTTQTGGPWLAAAALGGGDSTSTVRKIRATVDRGGLSEGTYFGKIAVVSDAGSASVDVVMSVLFAPPPLPDVNLRVQAIRVDTGLVAQTVTVNPLSTLTWSFPTLPAGQYKFVCGSDFDGDGVIGEPGDYYGIYGIEGSPKVVDLPGGTTVSNLDFRVAVSDSFSTAAAAPAAR